MTDAPERPCVHHLVADQARRTPDAVAVRFQEDSLSYAQVEARANRLAHHLIRSGVGPDTLVGLCVERSLDLPVALLGILKAGGAYLPLDPGYPRPRLALMLEDSRAPVIVSERTLLGALPSIQATMVLMGGSWQDDPGLPQDEPDSGVGLGDLAHVIYTSGSTGTPKGVMTEHGSLRNGVESMRETFALTERDVVLAVSTIAVDLTWLDVCLPLTVGAQVAVVSREDMMFGRRIALWLDSCGATFMEATPVTWRLLLEAGWRGTERLQMVSSGEALTEHLASSLLDRGARLWNGYGATEGGIFTTIHEVRRGESPIPIGRPIRNMDVHVLDEDGAPVAIGVEGELYAAGVGVARGYLSRPKLTSERFLRDGLGDHVEGRMYRSGDLGRRRGDGVLEYVGRVDQQLKIRGFRVEPGEIESLLAGHPDVRQVVVVAREDEAGEKRLVAYVVPALGRNPDPLELRRYVKDRLPSYMVPAAAVVMPALPLTPNRKVDRLALPLPDGFVSLSSLEAAPGAAPRGGARARRAWAERPRPE